MLEEVLSEQGRQNVRDIQSGKVYASPDMRLAFLRMGAVFFAQALVDLHNGETKSQGVPLTTIVAEAQDFLGYQKPKVREAKKAGII